MLHEEPPAEALANLGIAEQNEILLFRQELARRYPDSVSVRLELAGRLAQGRGARKALQLCNELLSSESGREAGFQIRRVRLNAAIACGEYEVAAEDFGYLLNAVHERTSTHRFHYTLAAIIARLDDWRARALIDLLQGMLPKPNPFEEILALKAAEFAVLRRLGDTIR